MSYCQMTKQQSAVSIEQVFKPHLMVPHYLRDAMCFFRSTDVLCASPIASLRMEFLIIVPVCAS